MRNDGRFKPGVSGNPKGRPPGTSKIGKMREEISAHIPEIIAKMAEQAKGGDSTSARLLLERVIPAHKPAELTETVAMAGPTLTAQGQAVIAAIASGEIAPSQGAVILAALASVAKLNEADELEKRIAALEALNKEAKP